MIFSPFDDDDVITSISDGVIHLIAVVSQVFDKNFLARTFRPIDGYEEQVGT
jgi:hypothetical protein